MSDAPRGPHDLWFRLLTVRAHLAFFLIWFPLSAGLTVLGIVIIVRGLLGESEQVIIAAAGVVCVLIGLHLGLTFGAVWDYRRRMLKLYRSTPYSRQCGFGPFDARGVRTRIVGFGPTTSFYGMEIPEGVPETPLAHFVNAAVGWMWVAVGAALAAMAVAALTL